MIDIRRYIDENRETKQLNKTKSNICLRENKTRSHIWSGGGMKTRGRDNEMTTSTQSLPCSNIHTHTHSPTSHRCKYRWPRGDTQPRERRNNNNEWCGIVNLSFLASFFFLTFLCSSIFFFLCLFFPVFVTLFVLSVHLSIDSTFLFPQLSYRFHLFSPVGISLYFLRCVVSFLSFFLEKEKARLHTTHFTDSLSLSWLLCGLAPMNKGR